PSPKRTSYGYESVMFSSTDGTQIPSEVLQNIVEMKVGISTPSENIPLNPGAVREKSNAIQMADGYSQIWWPAPGGSEAEDCQYGRCLIWEGTIPPATQNEIDNNPTSVIATLVVDYTIHSFAYSWWQDADLPSNVLGMTGGNGISKSTSGTFSDLDNIGIQYYTNAFGDKTQFYDRSVDGSDYAIDAESSIVIEIADMIQSSLPPEDQDNVFAFSHAAFIWVRDNIQYAKGLETARSGPACIQAEKGDCDEQSNAWMSIVRTKRVPTWYEMGILGSGDFSQWEAHGWSNIALPLSEETCNERNIEPTSCYIIGVVDVVNNKWLLYTPTVYSNFIQKATHSGDDVDSVYTRIYYNHTMKSFDHSYSTVGTPLVTDGTFMVNWKEGE
ncbi:MAG: transglutaminase domain-containing protein, partial [Candidatus Thermoplasmatota archaeon]|nr:transglutaminase domain-containing protein [Candidatus Thermoplasmatota archaeon]